jgi:hypothetical protein
MPIPFSTASAIARIDEWTFRCAIPEGWQQGRGAFGGLVLATLLRAMEACEPDRERRTRTLSGDLCAPALVGDATVTVRVLRRGSHQTNLAAELRQHDAVVATATAILSRSRPQPTVPALEQPPSDESWRDATLLTVGPPLAPVFTPHYEYRNAALTPFSIGTPQVLGWIRERERIALDAPALIGRLDAWWPCLFAIDGQPRPVATVSFVAELLCDPGTVALDVPSRYRARMIALSEGFFVELRELWQGDRVVALNQQTFAILR